ncbi:hypothetical protein J2T21_002804 [Paeniglutamicibacter psychrophenolicus]|nr:hypothetical protein [Paeniglutamicibacter psychrophenolicus]
MPDRTGQPLRKVLTEGHELTRFCPQGASAAQGTTQLLLPGAREILCGVPCPHLGLAAAGGYLGVDLADGADAAFGPGHGKLLEDHAYAPRGVHLALVAARTGTAALAGPAVGAEGSGGQGRRGRSGRGSAETRWLPGSRGTLGIAPGTKNVGRSPNGERPTWGCRMAAALSP